MVNFEFIRRLSLLLDKIAEEKEQEKLAALEAEKAAKKAEKQKKAAAKRK